MFDDSATGDAVCVALRLVTPRATVIDITPEK